MRPLALMLALALVNSQLPTANAQSQPAPQPRHGGLFPPIDLGLLERPDRALWQKPNGPWVCAQSRPFFWTPPYTWSRSRKIFSRSVQTMSHSATEDRSTETTSAPLRSNSNAKNPVAEPMSSTFMPVIFSGKG